MTCNLSWKYGLTLRQKFSLKIWLNLILSKLNEKSFIVEFSSFSIERSGILAPVLKIESFNQPFVPLCNVSKLNVQIWREKKILKRILRNIFASSAPLEANAKTTMAHCSGPIIIDPIMLILVWIKKADNSHWELYDRVWAHAQTISNLFYLWKREKTVFSWNKTLNQPSSANLKNRFFCWVLLQISCFFPFFSFLPLSNPLWSLFPFQMSICYNYPIRTY